MVPWAFDAAITRQWALAGPSFAKSGRKINFGSTDIVRQSRTGFVGLQLAYEGRAATGTSPRQ